MLRSRYIPVLLIEDGELTKTKQFKVIIIGNDAVGKTSLLMRYSDNIFTEMSIPTIGVDFKCKTILVDGEKSKLIIFDTAGAERFKAVHSVFYRRVHGVIITYDITNRDSFTDIS